MLVLRNEFRQRNGKAGIENTKEEGNRKIEVAISLVLPFVLNKRCTCQAQTGVFSRSEFLFSTLLGS